MSERAPRTLLFGVGLGPGDPDYMTVRARDIILKADRLVHFCKRGRRGNARVTADAIIAPDAAREIELAFPVTTEVPVEEEGYAGPIAAFYDAAAERLADEMAAGRTIAVLCDGDPFFYGSFMHLWRRLAQRFPTEVVPGVTGMAGAWTRAAAPITWGDDVMTVLPGTLAEGELTRRLVDTDAAVIMKLGRNLPKVRRALQQAGLINRAIYVERATMADQRVVRLAEKPDDEAPYFSMILVPGEGRRL
ncbi:MAG: precorrin-2 C(20)-methyltransferase [Methylobacterium sp. SCN 67-24]|uniref:precorrin-2 C(20)-methyltransferase n=1 Tax=Bosea sp. (in: a-proteobacteria) TaxID=1871050 RepID=UPI00086DA845|nr:precorrin-2 C(20)-methyltransferase [Bosea sp. (in: a-proteobacteria)]ODT43836.1 MAG: precorrin-2 C(20)-methyltransferase [Methylobacterium sp. SCN 67-24]